MNLAWIWPFMVVKEGNMLYGLNWVKMQTHGSKGDSERGKKLIEKCGPRQIMNLGEMNDAHINSSEGTV